MTPDTLLLGRIVDRTVDVGTCWEWTGATNGVGYGQISVNGRRTYVHRASYAAARGPIPAGLVLDHLCRNTLCVRPDHLEPITQRENTLRGMTGAKSVCAHGHRFTPANTYRTSAGHRQCRACKARREAVRRQRARSSR